MNSFHEQVGIQSNIRFRTSLSRKTTTFCQESRFCGQTWTKNTFELCSVSKKLRRTYSNINHDLSCLWDRLFRWCHMLFSYENFKKGSVQLLKTIIITWQSRTNSFSFQNAECRKKKAEHSYQDMLAQLYVLWYIWVCLPYWCLDSTFNSKSSR
jgi:hypothetical protein